MRYMWVHLEKMIHQGFFQEICNLEEKTELLGTRAQCGEAGTREFLRSRDERSVCLRDSELRGKWLHVKLDLQ